MTVFDLSINSYLADLPELVTAEHLAIKLGIKTKTIYQRHWRQSKNPRLNLLPPLLPIPGSNRLAASKETVISWWHSVNQPVMEKRVGRPTKAEQMAKQGGLV